MMKLSGEPSSVQAGSGSGSGSDKAMPKDAKVMMSILKDMNIMDYEPRVVNQLLEFSYRYISTILEDSRMLSNHARKKAVDIDDVKLAVQMYTESNLTSPPSRDILLDVAAKKNAQPLPTPKTSGGLHLPPDRYCLTQCNYKLKSQKKRGGSKSGGGAQAKSKPAPTFSVKNPPGVMFQAGGSVAKHAIKINNPGGSAPKIQIQPQVVPEGPTPVFSMTVNPMQGGGGGHKRKADQME